MRTYNKSMPDYDDSFLLSCEQSQSRGLRSYSPNKVKLRVLKFKDHPTLIRKSLCDISECKYLQYVYTLPCIGKIIICLLREQ